MMSNYGVLTTKQGGHTLFKFPRLLCVTGRSAYDRTDIVRVDVDQSGIGTSKESFSYLVSILQAFTLLLIFAFYSVPPHSSSSTLSCSLFPTGKAFPSVSVEC